jgi:hypothetical protein
MVLGLSAGSSIDLPQVLEYEVSWPALAGVIPWCSAQPSHSCSTGTPLV